jgi:filamentous hemagglutinin family protein
VSHNVFSRFDVDSAGAVFANQVTRARTIVAEVRGQAGSRIAGPIEVAGPRANLIFANQNGLQIDGGSFINFGSVALTTGAVALRDQTVASGQLQRYVDVNTTGGRIEVAAGGLSANLIRLELIAKNLQVDGAIENTYSSSTAQTQFVVGNSLARFDTIASPTDNLTPWVYYQAGVAQPRTDVALHFGVGSSVTSGRIDMRVTDKGAGVHNAGKLLASAGDFHIDSTGALVQAGGSLRAQGTVQAQVGQLLQYNTEGRIATISAGTNTRLQASGDIVNRGGEIAGYARAEGETDVPYAVSLKAGGTIENRTEIGAAQTAVIHGRADGVRLEAGAGIESVNARIVAHGALDMVTPGTARNESQHLAGQGAWQSSEGNWWQRSSAFHRDAGRLADPNHQGYWVAEGPVQVRAGRIENLGGQVFSNAGKVSFEAATDILTQAYMVGQAALTRSCHVFLCRMRAASNEALIGGQVLAADTIEMKAGGRIVNDGGQVLGQNGARIEAPEVVARARPVHLAIVRDRGLKAWLGDTWARLYAVDQGGSFTAQHGRLILLGRARQEGGRFEAADGIDGAVEVVRPPHRDPVRIEDHIGILWW